MIKDFNWHWEHQQGAMFLKEKYNSIDMKKSLAEFFYNMGKQDAELELLSARQTISELEDHRKVLVEQSFSTQNKIIELEEELKEVEEIQQTNSKNEDELWEVCSNQKKKIKAQGQIIASLQEIVQSHAEAGNILLDKKDMPTAKIKDSK